MKRWIFLFGRQPELGLAELLSALHVQKLQYTPTLVSPNAFMIECDDSFDAPGELKRLGGTIKIAEVNETMPRGHDSRTVLRELLKNDSVMRAFAPKGTGRWTFGISVYGAEYDRDIAPSVHDFGLDLKRYLKSRKRSARFVEPRGKSQALASVVVHGNGLLKEGGAEIVIVFGSTEVYRAQTRAVQDFRGYSERDYGRPERNPKSGSLPPKLAQIMINMAGKPAGAYIFDPFCGIGTVLQEGLLMGYKVGGCDNDTDQIDRATKNLAWLKKISKVNAQLNLSDPELLGIFDAAKVRLKAQSVDALVSEGVLGPPRSRPFSPLEASQVATHVAKLWKATLEHFKTLLKPDATLVITLPVLQTASSPNGESVAVQRQEPTFVPLLDALPKLGYRLEALVPPQNAAVLPVSARGTLVYSRPDQVVGRELLKLSLSHN